MNAAAYHFLIETRSSFRKKQQMFLNYLFPIGFYLMMGAVMPRLNPLFLENLIPAMIVFTIMASTILGLPEQIVTGRSSGVFRGYRANGVPGVPLLVLPALTCMIHVIITAAVIVLSAPVLFNAPAPLHPAALFAAVLLTVLCFSGISILTGSLSANSRVSVMFSQLIFIPSMLIGGLMIPYENLPESIQTAAVFLPSTHSMNLIRHLAYEQATRIDCLLSLSVLAAAGLISFVVSAVLFRR